MLDRANMDGENDLALGTLLWHVLTQCTLCIRGIYLDLRENEPRGPAGR